MKKVLLLIVVATLCFGNANSQVKRTAVKRIPTNVAAQAKAEVEIKAEAETKRREMNNSNCKFKFGTGEFVSCQNNEGYVVFEIPDMTASELKSAAYTTLSSMFKSPKDAITSVSDNIIELEGYSPSLYEGEISFSYRKIFNHIIFGFVIQFKDGKVRYNAPILKYIHMVVENSDTQRTSNISGVNLRAYFGEDVDGRLKSIEDYFNNMINSINSKLRKSNDW